MPAQPIEFKMPTKGVLSDLGYHQIPPDAAVDALNVKAFGHNGRQRVGQRAGTSKYYEDQLGSGAPVRFLMQTTIPFDATTATPTNTALDETWTYSNGTVNAVAGTRWLNKETASSGISDMPHSASSNSTRMTVASNALHYEGSGNVVSGCQLLDAITPGTLYTVRASVTLNTNTSFAFWLRFAGWGNDCIRVTITTSAVTGTKNGTTYVNYVPGGTPFSGAHAWEVRVVNNTFSVYMDNVLQTSFTTSDYSSIAGFGFGCGTSASENDVEMDNYQILVGETLTHNRQTNVIAVAGGNVYVGIPSSTISVATSGTGALAPAANVSGAFSQGNVYLVDGTNLKKLVVSTATVSTLTATAGSLPTSCTLACMYRDRLVLAAPATAQQNFFMSRVGTHTDFDYTQTDAAAAFQGNASTAGRIGEPIVALIPHSDDVLFIGGDHSIWAVNGDPSDGGSIDLVTDSVGVASWTSWTKAQDGSIYFVGTGGFFRLTPGKQVENLSRGKFHTYFENIHRGTHFITVGWDRDAQGCHIFVTPAAQGDTTHLWYDARTDSFWPMQFPSNHGPNAVLSYDGDDPDDRVLMLGSYDGYIRFLDEEATDDDGTAISSYLVFAPVKADELTEATLEYVDLILGEDSTTTCTANIRAAPTVELALNNPRRSVSRTFTAARRQTRWMQRVRGNFFLLKLSNSTISTTWSFEKAVAMMDPGGNVRRR